MCLQTVAQCTELRNALARIMAAAVHEQMLSVQEGVCDGLDAMVNPCLPPNLPVYDKMWETENWIPRLVAMHYFNPDLPGEHVDWTPPYLGLPKFASVVSRTTTRNDVSAVCLQSGRHAQSRSPATN